MSQEPQAPAPSDWPVFVRRTLIWGVFLGLLYVLRFFFPLILLTFVFSFAAGRAIAALSRRFPRAPRRPLVGAVFLGGVGALVGLGFLIGPLVQNEAKTFETRFPEMRESLARWIEGTRADHDRLFKALDPENLWATKVRDLNLASLKEEGGDVFGLVLDAARIAFQITSTFLLALLFSLLVLLDLPRLRDEVEAIRASRIGWLYEEVRGTVVEFGATLARVIESQAVIALVNTILTFLGLALLGVPSKFLLSTIVFFCSFIPVLGVFLSTAPICLVALSEGGFGLVMKCIGMVVAVHMVEAYVLNPRITGAYVHLNPVFVLVVLFAGEHLFGLWGLILGVPVAVTLLRRTRGEVRAAPA